MRTIASLVVVLLVAATGAPRVQLATHDATALRGGRDAVAIVARSGAAPTRRAPQVDPHAPPIALAGAVAIGPPPRVPLPGSPAPRAAAPRPRPVTCSARGPPLA